MFFESERVSKIGENIVCKLVSYCNRTQGFPLCAPEFLHIENRIVMPIIYLQRIDTNKLVPVHQNFLIGSIWETKWLSRSWRKEPKHDGHNGHEGKNA